MINIKDIKKEFSVGDVLKGIEEVVVIGRVCFGSIRVGDCFNKKYERQSPPNQEVEAQFITDEYNIQTIKIKVKEIGFRYTNVEEVYLGDVAKLTLEGEGIDEIVEITELLYV
jgi:hypothetical protein